MDRIELHDVEYGACTALVGRDQSVLFVDAGSVSRFTRAEDAEISARFSKIFARYDRAARREFLLTHYHRDHTSGFFWQLRRAPGYFSRVYLPRQPVSADGGNAFLLAALFSRFFAAPESSFARVNTSCLSVFERLLHGMAPEHISMLSAGDAFRFDGAAYRVLWPGPDLDAEVQARLAPHADALRGAVLALPGGARFLEAAESFCAAYAETQAAFSPASQLSGEAKRRRAERLSHLLRDLAEKKPGADGEALAPLRESLERVRPIYTELQNDLSLVFHNERPHGDSENDVLFPGDASPAVLERLSGKLFPRYYAVAAPHHGTESHVSPAIQNLSVSHFLISNGEYHAGGEIAEAYRAAEAVCHCTNAHACPAAAETGCCSRLARCFEQSARGALTLRCPAASGGRFAPCRIYVFGHSGVWGCHCDRR